MSSAVASSSTSTTAIATAVAPKKKAAPKKSQKTPKNDGATKKKQATTTTAAAAKKKNGKAAGGKSKSKKAKSTVPSAYSLKSLGTKLGVEKASTVMILNAPASFVSKLNLDKSVTLIDTLTSGISNVEYIQFFTKSRKELDDNMPNLKNALTSDGALWITWPKKSAGVLSDLDENIIRQIGLKNGIVDTKVSVRWCFSFHSRRECILYVLPRRSARLMISGRR